MSGYRGNMIIKNPATPTGPYENGSAVGVWSLNEAMAFKRQGVWPTQGISAIDPNFKYVSILLTTTSLSNANNNLFVDSSGTFTPISRNGNATQGSMTPYGTNWSNYFDGNGDYLTAPANAAWAFGTGDFTVECWVYFISGSAGGRITNRAPGAGSTGTWGFNISPTTFTFTEVVPGEPGVSASGLPTMTSTWTHLAACRSGSTLRLFANGVLVGSGTNTTNFSSTTYALGIGAAYETSITGYMSNVRIVKGTAVYTAAFTPPTTPLTAISGTSILTCQSNRFIDTSSNNFTITRNGDMRVTDYSPFAPTYPGITYNQSDITNWSGYFDGSGDYLTLPASSALAFGTGDFTVEFWMQSTVFSRDPYDRRIFRCMADPMAGTGNGWEILLNGNPSGGTGQLIFSTPSAGTIVSTTATVCDGTWKHIAVTRQGNTFRLFVDGALIATNTATPTISDPSTYNTYISWFGGTGAAYFNGSLSNVRFVKGTAVYTSAFTPPSSPLTAISGTSLLTCQNAAFTDNSTNNFVISQTGQVTVTGNSPFNTVGYWSNYFTGTNRLSIPSNAAFGMGTGDFTIECWINLSAPQSAATKHITDSGTANFMFLKLNTTQIGIGRSQVAEDTMFNYTFNVGTWYHVAFTRSGSTVRGFVNGVQIGSATNSINYATGALTIGNDSNGTQPLGGYLSNLRIVKGTALYTSNFTPPTTPLTAVSNTSVLTCQNGRFIDNSTNAFTITVTGSPTVESFDPFYSSTVANNGGSMYVQGVMYLQSAPNPANNPRTGDFTMECWAYPITFPNDSNLVIFQNVTNSYYIALQIRNSQVAAHTFFGSHADIQFTDLAPRLNSWNHLVISRINGTLYGYLNGVRSSVTASVTSDLGAGNGIVYVRDGQDRYRGYISDARVTMGTAVYPNSTYTVPTAPLTSTANTTFLLNNMNAGIYDATAINDLETVGNAQVSTVQSKFGGSSVYFDGTDDRVLASPNEDMNLSTGDFTVEAWIYTNTIAAGSAAALVRAAAGNIATGAELQWSIYRSGSTLFVRPYQSTTDFSINVGTIAANTWYHVAITRSGNTIRGFLNGVLAGTTQTISGALNNNTAWYGAIMGGITVSSVNEYWNGYIDDFRITKGVARYTATFTPPTSAFAPY